MDFKQFILIFVVSSVDSVLVKSFNGVLYFGIVNGVTDMKFIFGAVIAKGQLEHIEKNVTEKRIQLIVQTLQKKCNILIDRVTPDQDPLLTLLLRPELWTLDSCPKPYLLTPPSTSLFPSTSTRGSHLIEPLSDDCLRLLILGCHTPKKCVLAEITDNAVRYETTHQVLYWTIFNQKCTTKAANFTIIQDIQELIKHKCGMILEEYSQIEQMGFLPHDRDLYFEQLAVCGIHGYSQFITASYDMIASLQLLQGCFSIYKHSENPKRKCNLHMSGVTTAALSVLINHHYHPW